jgi:hypothetical protein
MQNENTERIGLDLAKKGETVAIKFAKQKQNSNPVDV